MLQHHGILGQAWGHINGPPYPLGSGDHSASERKAGWRKSLSSDSPSKRQYKKALDKVSKEEFKNKSEAKKLSDKKQKLENKIAKAKKLQDKYSDKISKYDQDIAKFNENVAKGKSIANGIIKDANKNGYTVASYDVQKLANKGRIIGTTLIGGNLGQYVHRQYVDVSKYNVRK